MSPVTTATHEERIPALTLGWRLKMALADSGMSREHMAGQLGVTVSTLSRWQGDRGAPPSRAYIAQWAAETGVSLRWLETGEGQPTRGPGLPDRRRKDHAAGVSELAATKRARTGGRNTPRYLPNTLAA